jgi:hypothetical protein
MLAFHDDVTVGNPDQSRGYVAGEGGENLAKQFPPCLLALHVLTAIHLYDASGPPPLVNEKGGFEAAESSIRSEGALDQLEQSYSFFIV